jgi:hypothetical protein
MKKFLRFAISFITMILILTLILIISYFLIINIAKSANSGVPVEAREYKDNPSVGKYYIPGLDSYYVFGRYIYINKKNNWIGLIGQSDKIWRIELSDKTYFMYQNPYINNKGANSIYSFKYNNVNVFTSEVLFGNLISIECEDKYCNYAKGVSLYDYGNKYADYR